MSNTNNSVVKITPEMISNIIVNKKPNLKAFKGLQSDLKVRDSTSNKTFWNALFDKS